MKTTIAIITALLITGFCSASNKIITFQKKKNLNNQRELVAGAPVGVKPVNGKGFIGILFSAHDSVLEFRTRKPGEINNTPEENKAIAAIERDKSLSDSIKLEKVMDCNYPDTTILPLSKIKKLSYGISDTPNGKAKSVTAFFVLVVSNTTLLFSLGDGDYKAAPMDSFSDYIKAKTTTVNLVPEIALLVEAADLSYMSRKFRPYKWQIKA